MTRSPHVNDLVLHRAGSTDVTITTEATTGYTLVIGLDENDVRQAVEGWIDRHERRQATSRYRVKYVLREKLASSQIPGPPDTKTILALRRTELRDKLLSRGYFSNEDIANLRNTTVSSARTFVARSRKKRQIFTVKHGRHVVVPGILLDADGQPTAISGAIAILVPLGLDGWDLWAWLASPSGWLSGDVPADVFTTDPERAMTAVRAYASELSITADT